MAQEAVEGLLLAPTVRVDIRGKSRSLAVPSSFAGTRNCIITTVAAIGMHSASLTEQQGAPALSTFGFAVNAGMKGATATRDRPNHPPPPAHLGHVGV